MTVATASTQLRGRWLAPQKFAETVRDETDLDKLLVEMVSVVQETMQPRSVSVWLKREDGETGRQGNKK